MIGIYARVSTDEQAQKGYSLQDQIKSCRKKANSDNVKEYIDDGISGEILDRPALTALRNDVKEGIIKKVICLDPDRLSRKLMNQLIITDEFDKMGVELVFVNGDYAKTPEGQLFLSLRGAISEFEKAKMNERMSRGRREKARQGKIVKDPKVYGYDYDPETEQLVINEEEAEVVRLIFDLFTKPNDLVKGINGIAHYLTSLGIKTKKGKSVWHRQVVRQILMNPVYKGEFYHNKWNCEGVYATRQSGKSVSAGLRPKKDWIKIQCLAIVNETTFNHAQQLLEESRRRWSKKSKRKYLLSGLLRCGSCGNTMTGRNQKSWGKYVPEYSDRKNYSGAKHSGCGRRVKCEEIDRYVWNQILTWLNNPEKIALAATSDQNDLLDLDENRLQSLEKKLENVRKGISKLLGLYATGEIKSLDKIKSEINKLEDQEAQLQKQLNQIKEKQKNAAEIQYTEDLIKEAANYYLSKGQNELTFEDKYSLIHQIVKEIIVYDDRVEIYTF